MPHAQPQAQLDLWLIEIADWTQDFSCAIVEMKEEMQRMDKEK
jgi:hypothetical protein